MVKSEINVLCTITPYNKINENIYGSFKSIPKALKANYLDCYRCISSSAFTKAINSRI